MTDTATNTERAKARAARLAAALNPDGTITPGQPQHLQETNDLEADFLTALTADTIGEGLQAIRQEAGMTGTEVSTRRGLSKGRLSQLESSRANPQLSSIREQADALDYDVTIVFTPRQKGKKAVKVNVT